MPVAAWAAAAVSLMLGVLLLDAATAAADGPPTVATGFASSISGTSGSATLNATVNPNGTDASYYFKYGTTSGVYTVTSSPAGDAGAGTSAVPVNTTISALMPGTTYYFVVCASNATTGETCGTTTEESFIAVDPPGVTTTAATTIGTTGATLNGTVTTNGASTTYYFDYSTTPNFSTGVQSTASAQTSTDGGVSQDITGLQPGTQYYYRLVAYNNPGNSVIDTTTPQTFTTL